MQQHHCSSTLAHMSNQLTNIGGGCYAALVLAKNDNDLQDILNCVENWCNKWD